MKTSESTDDLPPLVIQRYFAAHDSHDIESALSVFAEDARVVDEDAEHRGKVQIRDWLQRTSTEFVYTRTFLRAEQTASDGWLVENRLEGNFPGNLVDLRYRFRLRGELIVELTIAP